MDQFINFQRHADNAGVLVTAISKGVNARLHFANRTSPADMLTKEVADLKDKILAFSESAPRIMESLSEKGWKARAQSELSQVATAFRTLRDAAVARRIDLDKRRVELLKPLVPLDPMRACEIRQWARSQKPPEVVPVAVKNPEIAAAIVDFKALTGLSNDLIVHIENALIKQNLIQRYSMHAKLKPTPDNVLAHGTDEAEVNKFAEQAVENFELALSELEIVTGILNRTVEFYSIAAIVPRTDAFEMIMG